MIDAQRQDSVPTPHDPERPAADDAPPYATGREHLRDELARLDHLIKAATLRWRYGTAAHKDEEHWGFLSVSDEEVNAYLRAKYVPIEESDPPAPELAGLIQSCQGSARAERRRIDRRLERTPAAVALPARRLARLYDLTPAQGDLLLLCLLSDTDARYRRLFALLQNDDSRQRLSVEVALQILAPTLPAGASPWDIFGPEAAPCAHRLLTVGDAATADEPLPRRALRLEERVAGYLLGGGALDPRLAGLARRAERGLDWSRLYLEPAQRERLLELAKWWANHRHQAGASAVVFLHGAYGSGRLSAARTLGGAVGLGLLVVNAEAALRRPDEWPRLVEAAFREARLSESAVCWEGCEALLAPDQPAHRWEGLVERAERHPSLTFLVSQVPWEPAGRFLAGRTRFVRLEFPAPSLAMRERVWRETLARGREPNEAEARVARTLAGAFQLTPGQIADAMATHRGLTAGVPPARLEAAGERLLFEACRRQSARRLVSFARRIEPRPEITLDHLVLPPPTRTLLDELAARVRLRSRVYSELGFDRRLSLGKGVIALFTGPSGTGKTLAASVLASDHGVDLYQVDLGAVVSKYVGETERNLNRIFAEAEESNAFLFFDEADALFGKRGEVREARDRWANLEVNHLLQRIEEYSGTVILATNLRQNIDEAFLRRIPTVIEFALPGAEDRARILRGMFPEGVARPADHELAEVARRFTLSGGNLKNVVIDAAFRATGEPRRPPVITLRHLVAAVAREYQKMAKPITRADFGETFHPWLMSDLFGQ